MKYVIKSCNDRLWYVRQILIPDLVEQGIDEADIIVMNDYDSVGCLKQWLKICRYVLNELSDEEGVWHLQDDILISKDFYDVTSNTPRDVVCNGFVPKTQPIDDIYKVGYVKAKDYWTSFPCIYIPNAYLRHFLEWYDLKINVQGKYQKYVSKGKYEDTLFWQFMKEWHANDTILNIAPNIIQHVDYMLGGSVINKHFKQGSVTAFYWLEEDRESELAERIRRVKNDS